MKELDYLPADIQLSPGFLGSKNLRSVFTHSFCNVCGHHAGVDRPEMSTVMHREYSESCQMNQKTSCSLVGKGHSKGCVHIVSCRCIFLARLFPSSPCQIQATEKCQTVGPPEAESINARKSTGFLCPYYRVHPKQDLDPTTPSACEKRAKNDITTLSFCPTRC